MVALYYNHFGDKLMEFKKYITLHKKYSYEFDNTFKEKSKIAWYIFKMHFDLNKKITEIAEELFYSCSSIKRLIKKVENFFVKIDEIIFQQKYDYNTCYFINVMNDIIKNNNEFISNSIVKLCISHVEQVIIRYISLGDFPKQIEGEMKVSRDTILKIKKSYSRKNCLNDLIEYLSKRKIIDLNVPLYESIRANKGAIYFKFSSVLILMIKTYINYLTDNKIINITKGGKKNEKI